ncbi:hypothetical protein J6590_026625 [Homalodisca vitripennis]|nr:hypothetical protein J6590_026625 [Homalodisca vitripennis]
MTALCPVLLLQDRLHIASAEISSELQRRAKMVTPTLEDVREGRTLDSIKSQGSLSCQYGLNCGRSRGTAAGRYLFSPETTQD